MAKKKTGTINEALETALSEELKEVTERHTDGENKGKFKYGTVERMRVLDRCLKFQSLKMKEDGGEWGSAFDDEKGKTK